VRFLLLVVSISERAKRYLYLAEEGSSKLSTAVCFG
jgi:hypothetical protein